nr:hypothetical protein B0A51_05492 [Rachicladosporium sp. CCFEE 5018]
MASTKLRAHLQRTSGACRGYSGPSVSPRKTPHRWWIAPVTASLAALGMGAAFWYGIDAHLFLTTHETVPFSGRRRYAGEDLSDSEADQAPQEVLHSRPNASGGGWRTFQIPKVRGTAVSPDSHESIGKAQHILSKVAAVAGLRVRLQVLNTGNDCQIVPADSSTLVAGMGFFDASASEDQVAAVLSNAVAQMMLQHNRETNHLQGLYARVPLSKLFHRRYERNTCDKEKEADFLGMLLMAEAGYDPAVMATCWQELRKQRGIYRRAARWQVPTILVIDGCGWFDPRGERWLVHGQSYMRIVDGKIKADFVRSYVAARKANIELPVSASCRVEIPIDLHKWAEFKDGVDHRSSWLSRTLG